MKTVEFVDLLARHAGAAPAHLVLSRLAPVVMAGGVVSAAPSWGINPVLPQLGAALAVKLVYVAGLLAGGLLLVARVSQPGAPVKRAMLLLALVAGGMAVLAAVWFWQTPEAARTQALLGRSWAWCPWRVAGLSLPALVALLWALRGLAPTQLRLAGFAAGLLAGALGALGYVLFCPENSATFVFVWYTLGILIPAAAGAALGPRLLRW